MTSQAIASGTLDFALRLLVVALLGLGTALAVLVVALGESEPDPGRVIGPGEWGLE